MTMKSALLIVSCSAAVLRLTTRLHTSPQLSRNGLQTRRSVLKNTSMDPTESAGNFHNLTYLPLVTLARKTEQSLPLLLYFWLVAISCTRGDIFLCEVNPNVA